MQLRGEGRQASPPPHTPQVFQTPDKPCRFSGPACTTHCSGRTSSQLPHKPYLGRHPQMPRTAVLNPPAAGIPVPVPHPSTAFLGGASASPENKCAVSLPASLRHWPSQCQGWACPYWMGKERNPSCPWGKERKLGICDGNENMVLHGACGCGVVHRHLGRGGAGGLVTLDKSLHFEMSLCSPGQ